MLASELFAISQTRKCEGPEECHWCGAKCSRGLRHDDPPPLPFQRSNSTAKRPGNAFVCQGCVLWRAPKTTIRYLSGGYKDGQSAKDHPWWVCEEGAWTFRGSDYQTLWKMILKPPSRFCLAFLDGKHENLLQLMVANDIPVLRTTTPLTFTINNVPFFYSLYELKTALQRGETGKLSGVRELIKILGPCESLPPLPPPEEEKKPGRPKLHQKREIIND